METGREWSTGKPLAASSAYWRFCTVDAGVRPDLFSMLGTGDMAADQVTGRPGIDPCRTRVLS